MISMFCAEIPGGKRWMTLPEIESLGSWSYYNDEHESAGFMHSSAVAALAAVASYGGCAKPSNGMDVTIREVDLDALLADMGRTGPTANDGNAS